MPSIKPFFSSQYLFLVVCSLCLFACSSAPKIEPAALVGFKPEIVLQKRVSIQAAKPFTAPITVDAKTGRIYTVQNNEVVSYSASTGAQLWRSTTVGLVEAPAAVSQDGKSVLVLVQGKEALNLDAQTGKVLWRAILPAEMYVRPLSVKGVFTILTADGRVVGIDEDSGRRRWAFARTIPTLTVKGSGALVELPDGIVVVGLAGGKAIAVKISTGQLVWEANLAEGFGSNEVERISDVLPEWQTVASLGICANAYRNRMTCFNKDGQVTFSQIVSASASLVQTQSPNMLVTLDDAEHLKAWGTGSKPGANADWVFEGLAGRRGIGFLDIAAQGDIVFVSDKLGYIHGLHAKNGKTVVRAQLSDKKTAQLWAGLIEKNASLIAATDNKVDVWFIAQIAQ